MMRQAICVSKDGTKYMRITHWDSKMHPMMKIRLLNRVAGDYIRIPADMVPPEGFGVRYKEIFIIS